MRRVFDHHAARGDEQQRQRAEFRAARPRAIAARTIFNVVHLGKVVKLDFIVRKDTPCRRREFERRNRVRMPGFEAWIVSREDLVLSKLAWAKAGFLADERARSASSPRRQKPPLGASGSSGVVYRSSRPFCRLHRQRTSCRQ
jgi:hypothetical protein